LTASKLNERFKKKKFAAFDPRWGELPGIEKGRENHLELVWQYMCVVALTVKHNYFIG